MLQNRVLKAKSEFSFFSRGQKFLLVGQQSVWLFNYWFKTYLFRLFHNILQQANFSIGTKA